MSIVMRIIQRFDPAREDEFMALERKFDELEKQRPDFPKGMRMQPISSAEPVNSLIWQCEFPDMKSAVSALDFFNGDSNHEKLYKQQVEYMNTIRIEFYKTLDFS
jgi:hypothetical protein